MSVTALLMMESHIGTMGDLLYFVLASCKCVGHREALPFLLWLGHVGLLTYLARSGVRWQWPSLVPPGLPGGQMEAECAPGVLEGIDVGAMPFDEGARGQWRSELHLEELSQG